MLMDSFGRAITYLRISVTDRCNFRCVYCMPAEGVSWQSHETILRYEEIAEVVRIAAAEGINEIRLTGGEPLVRTGIPNLVRMISVIPGIQDISLTTNGLLLERYIDELADAGLKRINLSLDTLRPERFTRISRGAGSFEQVWRGLLRAEELGLAPLKLNMVVMRGVNDDEVVDMARLSLDHPWHVRYIELMPVKNQVSWGEGFPTPADAYYSLSEIRARLAPLGLEPVTDKVGSGPAQEFHLRGAAGRVGFISPVGEKFCGGCNRLRLTADGNLRPCLLSDIEIPLLPTLRAGGDILPLLHQAVAAKPLGHELSEAHTPSNRCMMQIGG